MSKEFKIRGIGAWYVRLVTGACLGHVGRRVTLVDKDLEKIAELACGRLAHL